PRDRRRRRHRQRDRAGARRARRAARRQLPPQPRRRGTALRTDRSRRRHCCTLCCRCDRSGADGVDGLRRRTALRPHRRPRQQRRRSRRAPEARRARCRAVPSDSRRERDQRVPLHQAVAKRMAPRGRGAIVMMSSLAAHNGGGPGAFAYAAAKAAVIAMTKGLAKELARSGVRVNCVSPGLIGGTDFHARFTPADAFAAAEKTVPLSRAGTPEEVASVVAFLASSEASYLTGETIEINGGLFMR